MANAHSGTRSVSRNVTFLALLGATALVSHAAFATDWYVDGKNGSAIGKGTATSPFKTVSQGLTVAKPGDTVHLLPTVVYPAISVPVSGTSAKPITLTGDGASPSLTRVAGGGNAFGIWVNANYVQVTNLDVVAPGPWAAIFVAPKHHHVTIANNVTHDSGGSGIQTVSDDYLTISHNVVYGNAKNTSQAFNSGISTLWNLDVDSNTGLKIVIDGNVIYANTNTPPCTPSGCQPTTAVDTDGNGIIVDDARRTQVDNIPYRGRIVVSNNVVFGNGGRGISVFSSDHVLVTGNTAYSNNQDPYESAWRPGEIAASYSSDVTIADNVVFSDGGVGMNNGQYTGKHVPLSVFSCSGQFPITVQNNLAFNPQNDQVSSFTRGNTVPVTIANTTWSDPMFVVPSLNPAIADFRARLGSPALGTADPATSAAIDLLGVSRAVAPSVGAFQNGVVAMVAMAKR